MAYIDSVLLNVTEWFCRKFQLLTGRTSVWLAIQLTNVSIIVYFVWAATYSWNSDTIRIMVALFCVGLLYALAQTIFKVPIETYESAAYQRVAKGFRNPRRVRDAVLRISFLTLAIVLFLALAFALQYPSVFVEINVPVHMVLLGYWLIVLTTVVLYLLACDPLPPCAGKLKEWLRRPVPTAVQETARQQAVSTGCDQ